MDTLVGQSFGRYRILEQLGQGGMATVYKAYDTRLERDVAVKVLRTERFAPADLERILKRFEREAKALARLTHPNIVPVIDYGEQEGIPYLVMPYLPGGTLKGRLGEPMHWQEAIRLLLPIARALDYAHRQSILHRDVKPSNMLITADGEPMLTDFGIAKILELEDGQTLTGTGVGVGTPEYMAPEQWMGKTVPQSDVYGLGVVLYELVTGRKPYTADTPAAVLLKHVSEPLPRPLEFAPDLPEAVEKIILKALARQPEDRYASMAEMAAAMERALMTANRGQQQVDVQPPVTLRAVQPEEDGATIDQTDLVQTSLSATDPAALRPTPQAVAGKQKPWRLWAWGVGGLAMLVLAGWALSGLLLKPTPTPTLTLTPVPTLTRAQDGMVMVYVPAGPFKMGSTDGEEDERPIHTVTLDAFWIDQTEVTNAMYALCVQAGACNAPVDTTYYGDGAYANHPVVYVDWYQASNYCAWVGGRLPTEAEWEKAARGGLEGKRYPWGDELPTCQAGARNGAQYRGCDGLTVAVGTFQPNGYGLYDMAGNVWEWVSDWYDPDYYRNSPASNPTGPISGGGRVLRGGSWFDYVKDIRSAVRHGAIPDYSNDFAGFRCLRSIPEGGSP